MRRRKSGWFALVLGGAMAGLLTAVAVLPFGVVAGLGVRAALATFDGLPADLATPRTPQTSYLYAADGTLMTTFADEDRTDVPLSAIAPVMRDAIVAAEDARFYRHGAVDPRGIVRALVADTGSGSAEQGASTLTMQYVRNVLKTAPDASGSQRAAATADTVARKLQEVRYAAALEHRLGKDEILDRYLNIVYFGAGAYGVAAAARTYFSTTPARLTAAQATLLAGLVQSPDRYDPIDGDRSAALDRRAYVVDAMVRAGTMTAADAARVTTAPMGLKPARSPSGCTEAAQAELHTGDLVPSVTAARRHDLTDVQWAVLYPLLPAGTGRDRPRRWAMRLIIDGIRWRVRTGAPWRDVPSVYPPWQERGRAVLLRLPGLVVAAAARVRHDPRPAADRAARGRIPDRRVDGRRGPGEGDRGGGRGVRVRVVEGPADRRRAAGDRAGAGAGRQPALRPRARRREHDEPAGRRWRLGQRIPGGLHLQALHDARRARGGIPAGHRVRRTGAAGDLVRRR